MQRAEPHTGTFWDIFGNGSVPTSEGGIRGSRVVLALCLSRGPAGSSGLHLPGQPSLGALPGAWRRDYSAFLV